MSTTTKVQLNKTMVAVTKTKTRPGYVTMSGQVYLPPTSDKRKSSWKKKMEGKGYTFSD